MLTNLQVSLDISQQLQASLKKELQHSSCHLQVSLQNRKFSIAHISKSAFSTGTSSELKLSPRQPSKQNLQHSSCHLQVSIQNRIFSSMAHVISKSPQIEQELQHSSCLLFQDSLQNRNFSIVHVISRSVFRTGTSPQLMSRHLQVSIQNRNFSIAHVASSLGQYSEQELHHSSCRVISRSVFRTGTSAQLTLRHLYVSIQNRNFTIAHVASSLGQYSEQELQHSSRRVISSSVFRTGTSAQLMSSLGQYPEQELQHSSSHLQVILDRTGTFVQLTSSFSGQSP